jgi:hypothetical protein
LPFHAIGGGKDIFEKKSTTGLASFMAIRTTILLYFFVPLRFCVSIKTGRDSVS